MNTGLTYQETSELLQQLGAGSETLARLRRVRSLTSSQTRFLSTPPGVAAFVAPDQSRAMFIDLYTALFASDEFVRRVVKHEDMHLRHQEMMNLEIPFFSQLEDIYRSVFRDALGEDPFEDLIDLIEGFTEGSVAKNEGHKDPNVAYTHDQVPMVERLDNLVKAKSGGSLIDDFRSMDSSSRPRFIRHMRQATNVMMLEKILFKNTVDPDRDPRKPRNEGEMFFSLLVKWFETFPSDYVIRSKEDAERIVAWFTMNIAGEQKKR